MSNATSTPTIAAPALSSLMPPERDIPPSADPDRRQWAVDGVSEHPLRERLNNEIHARPSIPLRSPTQLSHLALLTGELGASRDAEMVIALCRRFGAAEPPEGVGFWHVDLGPFELNWERHVEFSTYTFFRQKPFDGPFRQPTIEHVPKDWLRDLNGDLLVAIHAALEPPTVPLRQAAELESLFASDNIAGCQVAHNCAVVWTDFRLQGDGFSRLLIHDQGLRPRQAGRLVQRLLEIETYRMMALLSFPLAREYAAQVSQADSALVALTAKMMDECTTPEAERQVFEQISRLAGDVERIGAVLNYRFSASRAYYALTQRRFQDLREERIPGHATLGEFMERRLAPAMRTCESLDDRLQTLSERIGRAANLLRTRVDVTLEEQNQSLLSSMDRRAKMQLRLQQTVEGLSVVVISYYLLSIIKFLLGGVEKSGLLVGIGSELIIALAIAPVMLLVWLSLRRLHHRLHHEARSEEERASS